MHKIEDLEYNGSMSVVRELIQIVKTQQSQIEILQLGLKAQGDITEKLLGVLSGRL